MNIPRKKCQGEKKKVLHTKAQSLTPFCTYNIYFRLNIHLLIGMLLYLLLLNPKLHPGSIPTPSVWSSQSFNRYDSKLPSGKVQLLFQSYHLRRKGILDSDYFKHGNAIDQT